MPRRAEAAAATVAVLLFWIGIFTAGAQVSGYSAQDDYISNLASRGSPMGGLAIAALLASAAAHAVTASCASAPAMATATSSRSSGSC